MLRYSSNPSRLGCASRIICVVSSGHFVCVGGNFADAIRELRQAAFQAVGAPCNGLQAMRLGIFDSLQFACATTNNRARSEND